MALYNIIEICVAIDISILGIAYPIIVDKISEIGEKYNSNYLSNVFNSEFPQKSLKYKWRKKNKEISYFKLFLYTTILSFLPLIIQNEPWFEFKCNILNYFINNSAEYIVLSFTITLTFYFFKWLDIVVKYNGKATSIVQHLITHYYNKSESEDDYNLKTINEFSIYAIDKQDAHLQNTLLEFYHTVFSNIRRKHNRSKPLIYPVDLYEMVYRLCYKLIDTDNKHLLALEHRAVSGSWFLGEDLEQIEISDETYSWLWRNLNTIAEKEKFIRMYWGTAHQYYSFKLQSEIPEYNNSPQIVNEQNVIKRHLEQEKFLEFNFALGGLLLYRKQYQTIKYIFNYTQSQPPSYVLLPENMSKIYHWFEIFSNEFKSRRQPIYYKFYFEGLDNLGTRREVSYWICSYMTLLFIRLYSLHQFYTFQQFTTQPNLPNKIHELREWLRAIPSFEKSLQELLENDDLLKTLGLEKVVEENKERFYKYIQELKIRIEAEIEAKHINAELSDDKLRIFNESSVKIITNAFAEYNSIVNKGEYVDNEDDDSDLKLTVKGETILSSKSSFMDDTGVAHLNYDSFLASGIASHSIRRYIPNSFITAKTRRYLLNRDNLIAGIKLLIGDKNNVVIVAINLDYETKEVLKEYKSILKEIRGGQHQIQDSLFILKESDLPYFIHKQLDPTVVEEEHFTLIDDNLNIYSSILDLSQPQNAFAKQRWTSEDLAGETKVQITIGFLTLIVFKKDREIVQLNVASRYREQGIQNGLDQIEPLK